jgi:hypothetical protein
MIHIQQRKHKVDGWPQHGVHDKEQIPKAEAVMELLESTPNVRVVFHGHNHNETGVYVSGDRRYFFDSPMQVGVGGQSVGIGLSKCMTTIEQ